MLIQHSQRYDNSSKNPEFKKSEGYRFYSGKAPHDYVYPRLRKRMMNDLAGQYENRSLPYPSLMIYQFDEWNRIAQFLLDVTCAKNPEAMM